MKQAQKIKLTRQQADCLAHRLEIPECIAEALEADPLDVSAVCDRLIAGLPYLPDVVGPLDADILADAIEGSTWALCGEDEDQRRAWPVYARCAAKVEAAIGRKLMLR